MFLFTCHTEVISKCFFPVKTIYIGTEQVEALHAFWLSHFHASVTKLWLVEYRSMSILSDNKLIIASGFS